MGHAKQTTSIAESSAPSNQNGSGLSAVLASVPDNESPALNAALGDALSTSTLGLGLHGTPPVSITAPRVRDIYSREQHHQLDGAGHNDECLLRSNRPRISYGAIDADLSNQHSGQTDSHAEAECLLPDGLSRGKPDLSWESAVMAGLTNTTWQREAKVLFRYAMPLIVTFMLQYSLPTASVLAAGNLGKNELAAVSLAGMTASITGFAIYQGLATSLDTLCAQAYGAGKKELVGLHMQRMVLFLLLISIPISLIWFYSENILNKILPEPILASLAGQYLRILIFGLPGYAMFEAGKRFTQAQGLFSASTWVLLIAAPTNAVLNWVLVWHPKIGIGYRGAPTAVAITEWLMPFLLFLYVRFINGYECWGGFSRKAWTNWGPMITLAVPGLLMVMAEYLAFEILTLLASYFSTAHVAAQSVVSTTASLAFQIPFAVSICCSTRVANLIGAGLKDAAKTAAYTGMVISAFQGAFNATVMFSIKSHLPKLFTSDSQVIELVSQVLPLVATFQLFDSLASVQAGILRGQGRQYIGGWVNLIAYYVIALPLSCTAGFIWHWDLLGLWSGVSLALFLVAWVMGYFVFKSDWQKVVDMAKHRNVHA